MTRYASAWPIKLPLPCESGPQIATGAGYHGN
jgi:hypothetical protein